MRWDIKKTTFILFILTIIFGSFGDALATTVKPLVKKTLSKTTTVSKKTATKKVVKKVTKKKVLLRRKEKLILNPPLIDPMNPPGGR